MKVCTVIRGPKSKIEFVWDKNLITFPLILPHLKNALRPVGNSKRYNSVPVKDNCALFTYPLVSGSGISNGVI